MHQHQHHTPLDAPLFPIPDDQVFSAPQWQTLLSLADVVVPALTTATSRKALHQKTVTAAQYDAAISALTVQVKRADPSADPGQVARQYLDENASSLPAFKESLRRAFVLHVPQESKNGLSLILSALKYVSFLGTNICIYMYVDIYVD